MMLQNQIAGNRLSTVGEVNKEKSASLTVSRMRTSHEVKAV